MNLTNNQIREIKKYPQERGFAGCVKKIPNMISGSAVTLAQPWEVDIRMDELLSFWESSIKDFKDIVNKKVLKVRHSI